MIFHLDSANNSHPAQWYQVWPMGMVKKRKKERKKEKHTDSVNGNNCKIYYILMPVIKSYGPWLRFKWINNVMSICSKLKLTCTFTDNYRIYRLQKLSDCLQWLVFMVIICNFRSTKYVLSRVFYSRVYLIIFKKLAISLNKIWLQICTYFKIVIFMLSKEF